jgi:DNA-binding response OmpR family regulator
MTRILIAEDEDRISGFLARGLRANGYATTVVASGADAVAGATGDHFDLLILDLGLPGKDGLEVVREVRGQGGRLPIIILTARRDVHDTVAGLDAGANDYITKPFRFEELLARVRVALRDTPAPGEVELRLGDVSLDLRSRQATIRGEKVELTAREFTMLETFLRHRGQVLSREQLLSHVWGYDFDPGSNIVDVYVGYLRKKLGNEVVETIRGMGYRMSSGS